MGYLLVLGVRKEAWKRLGWAMGGVVLIATILGFVGWAAAISWAAWLNLQGVNARDIAQNVFLATGAIGVIVAFLYLGVHR